MFKYGITIGLFTLGVIILIITKCDGYWSTCGHGWSLVGVILCSLAILIPFLLGVLGLFKKE